MSSDRNRDRSRSPRNRGPGGRDRRDRRSSSSTHSDRMVYLSNIPYNIRWMELKDMIREKAGDVTFVEILETPDGKSKGCAVVEFKDREGVKKCEETMHRLPLGDRNLVVKEIRDPERFFRKVKEDTGVDFLGRSMGGSSSAGGGSQRDARPTHHSTQNYETYGLSPVFLQQLGIDCQLCNRVFIANLDFKVGSLKLFEVFSLAGHVVSVDLQMDKEGKSKGLAVVEYLHPIEAVQAISMLNNQYLYDRKMTVKMDRFDKLQEYLPGEKPSGLRDMGPGLGEGGVPLTNIAQAAANYVPSNQQSGLSLGGNSGVSSNLPSLLSGNMNAGLNSASFGLGLGGQASPVGLHSGGLGLSSFGGGGGSSREYGAGLGGDIGGRGFAFGHSTADSTLGTMSAGGGQYGSLSNVGDMSERLLVGNDRVGVSTGQYERLTSSSGGTSASMRAMLSGSAGSGGVIGGGGGIPSSREGSYFGRAMKDEPSDFGRLKSEFPEFKDRVPPSSTVIVRNVRT